MQTSLSEIFKHSIQNDFNLTSIYLYTLNETEKYVSIWGFKYIVYPDIYRYIRYIIMNTLNKHCKEKGLEIFPHNGRENPECCVFTVVENSKVN